MSMRSAPCSIMAKACSTAASGLSYRPPSENESGVTLRTPMSKTPELSGIGRPLALRISEPGMVLRFGMEGSPQPRWGQSREVRRMRVCGKEGNSSLVTDPTADTLSPYRVGGSGPPRYPATRLDGHGLGNRSLLHDFVDLKRVQHFFFQERLSQCPKGAHVFGEHPFRAFVVLGHQPFDLMVNLQCHLFAEISSRCDFASEENLFILFPEGQGT